MLGGEGLVQGFGEVLYKMKAVGDLGGRGSPVACALGLGARPIPRDHLNSRMLSEPLGEGLGGAIVQEGDGLAAL